MDAASRKQPPHALSLLTASPAQLYRYNRHPWDNRIYLPEEFSFVTFYQTIKIYH
jgi:hypothetical protein